MQPTGNPYLDTTISNNMARGPQTPTAPTSHGGGFLGGIYDTIFKPTVSTIAGMPSDFYHTLTAAGIGLGSAVRGEHGSVANSTKQRALDEVKKSAGYGQFFKSNVADQQANTGKTLEGVGGKAASNIANVEAFNPALASVKGATALQRTGQAMKLGGALGAAQGIGSQMQQGAGLGDVLGGGVTGGITGAAVGGGLQGAGEVIKGLAGRGAANAGKTVAPGQAKGFVQKAAAKAGGNAATNAKALGAAEFPAAAQSGIDKIMGRDKVTGHPVGLTQVQDFLRGVDMPENSAGMQTLHDLALQNSGMHLENATKGITVDASNAAQEGTKALSMAATDLGTTRNVGSAASKARAVYKDATEGLGMHSTVQDVMGAISKLEGAQKKLAIPIANARDTVAQSQHDVYQAVIDHLDGVLNNAKVNEAVAGHRVDPTDAQLHALDVINGGGSQELAEHLTGAANQAKTYQELRSTQQIPVLAGKYADLARVMEANKIAQPAEKGNFGSPAWMLAMAAHNPGYLVPAAARIAGNAGLGGKILSKLAPRSYNGALEAGLAPAEETAAKIYGPGGEPSPTSQPLQGTTTPGVPETPTTVQFPQSAGGSVPLPVQGARPDVHGIPAGTTLTPENGYKPTLSQLNMTKPQLAAQTATPISATTTPGMPETPTNIQFPQADSGASVPVPINGAVPPAGTAPAAVGGGSMNILGMMRNNVANVSAGGVNAPAPQPSDQGLQQASSDQALAGFGAGGGMGDQSQQTDYSLQAMEADVARDPAHMADYEALYKNIHAAEAPPALTAGQKTTIAGIQSAVGSLAPYAKQLEASGSPGSIGGGIESFMGGLPGASAQNANIHGLDKSRVEIATQIAKALTNGKPSAQLIKEWENAIPSVTDTPQVRAAQWQTLSARLQGELSQAQQSTSDPGQAVQLLTQLGATNGQ